ncbi:MAG: Dabb family protein [Kiritimatiellia bacterium]
MIRHVVAWRLKDSALGNAKAANARRMKEKLEALRGRIPGLLRLEVGLDFSAGENSSDVVLLADFESREALAAYLVHPEHQAVVAFVSPIVAERRLVDCETD